MESATKKNDHLLTSKHIFLFICVITFKIKKTRWIPVFKPGSPILHVGVLSFASPRRIYCVWLEFLFYLILRPLLTAVVPSVRKKNIYSAGIMGFYVNFTYLTDARENVLFRLIVCFWVLFVKFSSSASAWQYVSLYQNS